MKGFHPEMETQEHSVTQDNHMQDLGELYHSVDFEGLIFVIKVLSPRKENSKFIATCHLKNKLMSRMK